MKAIMIIVLLLNCFIEAQQQDTTREKPTGYRRGVELREGYQSYDEKYAGKDLNEEKKRLFPLNSTGVWTELNPKVPRVDYLGIHFINKDTGWAVGDLGSLIKTTDGAISWTVSQTNTTTPILKVRSFDGQLVIASGFNGLILRSSDGGETFTQITSGVTGDLWGLEMLNDTVGWACGNRNSLIKTTDGGLTWQRVITPGYTSDYWWIDFLTERYGFIAANGNVLKTTDGGTNWEILQAGDSYPLFCLDVIDSLHIAAAGYGGTGYPAKNIYSSNGGNTWTNGGLISTTEVNCINYINTDTGYIVQSEVGLRKTTNRGINWILIDSASFTGIGEYEIQLLKHENVGYNAGTVIKLYKSVGNFDEWERLIINDNFYDVHFITETTGFAISGAFYQTTNGGLNWKRNLNAPGGYDVLFIDSTTGFIGGDKIYKTTNGGSNWYETNSIGFGAGKIFFVTNQLGWATSGRSILKTTDGGENWFVQITLPSDSYTSIFFIDSLNGWATSRYIWQTTDGGVNWIQRTDISIYFSYDVYFPNSNNGWIGRYSSINNSLFKTTDGGLNWIGIPEVVGARKLYFFPDPVHWLTIGFSRYYITNDFGNNWIEFTNDVPAGLVSFIAPSNQLGYSVGSKGLILKYNDTSYIPVELISFEGKIANNNVILSWVTASEINNQGFHIMKSMDNINWNEIGFVYGRGTSTERNYYSFIDGNISSNEIFYQLVQKDFDGSRFYSEIIKVYNEFELSSHLLFQNFPNPFNSNTEIKFYLPEKELVNISIYALTGEKILELINKEKNKGFHLINFVSELPSGVYFYRIVTSSGYTANKKLITIK